MASVKLASLAIRTLAKPISNQIKAQSQEHPLFRKLCVELAQWSYRSEYRLRTSLLGESPKAIKPLSEARAVQNGANMLAEGFLFTIAAGLILAETWRSSRSTSKRRDTVDDSIDELKAKVTELENQLAESRKTAELQWEELRDKSDEVTRILDRVLYIGMKGGWEALHEDSVKLVLAASVSESDREDRESPEPSPSVTVSSLPLDEGDE